MFSLHRIASGKLSGHVLALSVCSAAIALVIASCDADVQHPTTTCEDCNIQGIQLVVLGDSMAMVRQQGSNCGPFAVKWSNGVAHASNQPYDTIRLAGQRHVDVTYTDACGNSAKAEAYVWPQGSKGTVVDAQGNAHSTVQIGEQTWMAENLKTELPLSWCFAENQQNCELFGRLYPWYVALEACPDGWHLPTDDDWKQLELHLGMDSTELDFSYLRGTGVGGKLKSVSHHWDFYNDGATDETGFSALPGGPRYRLGQYGMVGHNNTWWTATEADSLMAWFRYVGHSHSKVGRLYNEKIDGHSVRCVKDSL